MARPEWEIEILDSGDFDVRQGGRAVAYDLDDLAEAVRRVKRGGGHSYDLIEPDGYRTTHRC